MGKIIITGTGRSGTSFLVHLLSALGMDTGYTEEECAKELSNACKGGCEHTIEKPYNIIKNPEFMLNIEEIVKNNDIEHVIIPIRKADEVVRSRANNSENHGGYGGYCFDATNSNEQHIANSHLMYNLFEVLTRYEIPFTTIAFPRMVEDVVYLDNQLKMVGLGLDICEVDVDNELRKAFNRIANTDKITIK